MSTVYAFSAQASALAVAAAVDVALGYPQPAVDAGSGHHAFPRFVTQTYVTPVLVSGSWLYPSNPTVLAVVAPNAVQLQLPAPTLAPVPVIPAASVAVQTT